jgi:hypothetical protein
MWMGMGMGMGMVDQYKGKSHSIGLPPMLRVFWSGEDLQVFEADPATHARRGRR